MKRIIYILLFFFGTLNAQVPFMIAPVQSLPLVLDSIDMGTWTIYIDTVDLPSTYAWDDGSDALVGATENYGGINTDSIVAEYGTGDYASYACDTLTRYGYNDWYLPSVIESDSMYNNLNGFETATPYWTSNEAFGSSSQADYYDYSSGSTTSAGRGENFYVRCIRASGLYWYLVDSVGITAGEWDINGGETDCTSECSYTESAGSDSIHFDYTIAHTGGSNTYYAQWDYDNSVIEVGDSIYIKGSYRCTKEAFYCNGRLVINSYSGVDGLSVEFDDGTSYNTGNVSFNLKGIVNSTSSMYVYFESSTGSGMTTNYEMDIYISDIIVKRKIEF